MGCASPCALLRYSSPFAVTVWCRALLRSGVAGCVRAESAHAHGSSGSRPAPRRSTRSGYLAPGSPADRRCSGDRPRYLFKSEFSSVYD
eukprot:6434469-Prymnesium_polylepis.1